MSEMSELPYPEWQVPLQEVILEWDREKLVAKAQRAESLILERLRQLQQSNDGHHERDALNHGLSILRTIRRESLDDKALEEANRHSFSKGLAGQLAKSRRGYRKLPTSQKSQKLSADW